MNFFCYFPDGSHSSVSCPVEEPASDAALEHAYALSQIENGNNQAGNGIIETDLSAIDEKEVCTSAILFRYSVSFLH